MSDFPAILRRLGDVLDGMNVGTTAAVRMMVAQRPESEQVAVLAAIHQALPELPAKVHVGGLSTVQFGGQHPKVIVAVSTSLVTDEPMPDPEVRVRTFAEVIA